jgi:enoyl-CoA hydratase/carnithine racemase
LTASEAEAIGLVTRVVPDEQLIAQAESMANELAHGTTGIGFAAANLENESIADVRYLSHFAAILALTSLHSIQSER